MADNPCAEVVGWPRGGTPARVPGGHAGGATRVTDPELRYGTPTGRWVLVATVLGSGMAGLDATVVGIALPAIGRDLGVDVAGLQWVVNAYTLTLAGLLLLGGTLGDRYGRRRVFVAGSTWLAAAAPLCGVAPDPTTPILPPAQQGVGGALPTPPSPPDLQAP